MSFIDIAIIVSYILIVFVISYFCGKTNDDTNNYFLASKKMPWIPIALSVSATLISANGFIGGPGWAYTDGMMPFMVNVSVPIACFVSAWLMAPVMYHLKVTTIYEYIGMRFGKHSRLILVFHFLINSLIQISSMVFIPTLVLHKITNLPLGVLAPAVVIITIIYTSFGGIKAVIWTDTLQMCVMWISVLGVIYVCVKSSGMGFFEIVGDAHARGMLNTLDFSLDLTNTNGFWATLFGGSLMWIRYFAFDQTQVQRVLTAKSLKSIKISYFTSSILMNITYFIMLFVGVLLYNYYGGISFNSSNDIMIDFILNHLPVGLVGIAVAGVIACVMSSVDSMLNSLVTVVVADFISSKLKKGKRQMLSKKQLFPLFIMFGIIIVFVILVGFKGTVKSVLDVVGGYVSYFLGPILALFILGFCTQKANDVGVSIGVIFSMIATYIIGTLSTISWMYNIVVGFVLGIISEYLLSVIVNYVKGEQPTINEFSIKGILTKIPQNELMEDGYSTKPLYLDKYSIGILVFIFLQYIFLFAIQR